MDIGANVVFVDIDPVTLCIDPGAIKAAITPRTKAIIPVHLYGCMCDMDAIMKIARKHRLKVIEDVAHQHGSRWKDQGAGAIGDAGSFSFQQSKALSSGEGGAITCDDEQVYEIAFALKHVGWKPADLSKSPYDDLVPGDRYGHNYRITEMQAALLRGGLSRLAAQLKKKEDNAAYLTAQLEKLGGPLSAVERDSRVTRQSYYMMTFYYDPAKAEGVTLDQYQTALDHENATFLRTYDPVYQNKLLNLYDQTSPIPYRDQTKVQDYKNLRLPNTERACFETALLLFHYHLLGSKKYMDQIVRAIRKVNDNLLSVKQHFEGKGVR